MLDAGMVHTHQVPVCNKVFDALLGMVKPFFPLSRGDADLVRVTEDFEGPGRPPDVGEQFYHLIEGGRLALEACNKFFDNVTVLVAVVVDLLSPPFQFLNHVCQCHQTSIIASPYYLHRRKQGTVDVTLQYVLSVYRTNTWSAIEVLCAQYGSEVWYVGDERVGRVAKKVFGQLDRLPECSAQFLFLSDALKLRR